MVLAILAIALILAVLGAGYATPLLWVLVLAVLIAMVISYSTHGRIP